MRKQGALIEHDEMNKASSPYQYESRPPEINKLFSKVVLEKISVDFRPIPRPMSRSCLEVKVPNEAIKEVVTLPFCNKVFQHLEGGIEDRSKEIWPNSKEFKIRALEERQGHKPKLKIFKKLWYQEELKGP